MSISHLFAALLLLPLAAAAPVELVSEGRARGTIAATVPAARRAADLLAARIERRTGVRVPVRAEAPAGAPAVRFVPSDDPALGPEGFRLEIQAGQLLITARPGRGWIYGAGKVLRTARYGAGRMAADPPPGLDRPAMPRRMLYLAIHADNFYEMQEAATIHREVVEDMALWGVNGVWVWFDQSQYPALETPTARTRWDKEKEVLRRAQELGLDPGYVTSDNDLYRNQVVPGVKVPNPNEWATFQALACPSLPRGRETILANKETLAREMAAAGIRLRGLCHFAYDTGGCLCDRCRPWVLTYLKLTRDVHETFRRYHPEVRSYMSDWHFKDEEAQQAIAFFARENPAWIAGIFKDDRHPPDRFTAAPARYPVHTFLEITEIGGWGTVGANPFPARLGAVFDGVRRSGQQGYVAYSEGIYDDFNKAAAARIAWNPAVTPAELAAEYANYFFDGAPAADFARLVAGMEASWTNPLGSYGQQQFAQGAEEAAVVEKTAAAIAERLPEAVRRGWRWQVFDERARIGAAIAALGSREEFRARVAGMVREGKPRVETRRVLEDRRTLLEEAYGRRVRELRESVYREPFTRYPPMNAGDWFMRGRTQVDYAAWEQLFQELSAVADGIAKP